MADLSQFPLTDDGVRAALADLDKGGSEDVAARLEELSVKGERDTECGCPVAVYLKNVLPDVEYAFVGGESVFITGIAREQIDGGFVQSWDVRLHATLPDSVSAFVEDFDQGIYPQLVESTEGEASHG